MLEEILILFNELLTSKPAVLIKEVNFKHLLLVLSIGRTEQCRDHKREKVPESSEPHVLCEDVVVVGVEKLF